MPDTQTAASVSTKSMSTSVDLNAICKRIPPLWDLPNYVAVNPFLGFSDEPIANAAAEIGDALQAQVLPDLGFYRRLWEKGELGIDHLRRAAIRSGHDPREIQAILEGQKVIPLRPIHPVSTFAAEYDGKHGTDLQEAITRSIARWCAVSVSEGGTHWNIRSINENGLYASWREAAEVDRSLEILGLRGWRNWVKRLPETPSQTIEAMISRLSVPEAHRESYLYRLLGTLYGWASYLRRAGWEQGSDKPGPLEDLLAILIASDAAVAELDSSLSCLIAYPAMSTVEDETVRLVLQDAWEDTYSSRVLSVLKPSKRRTETTDRPSVQAVFCIDVRSEPIRRQLEAQSLSIETRGFAGFFGVSLDWTADGESSARCPVLLKPTLEVRALARKPAANPKKLLKSVQTAPAASFSFVEVFGLAYGLGLACDALTAIPTTLSPEGSVAFEPGSSCSSAELGLEDRVNLAAGILKNLGLRTSFARLILLCGHEGRCTNNPHAAALHCGACGGHGGAINARIASAVLNDPEVRTRLVGLGWCLPADTWFVPGVHDTSIDEVKLLDTDRLPESHQHDLSQLERWLKEAGNAVRAERAESLGLDPRPLDSLLGRFQKKASDWSEIRPEWGLARNATFIAARRDRTRGVNLGGRSFLHEYDCSNDPDQSILTLILSAPMVVASWINLQYFASTVDNNVFGCGNKAIHNRVGSIGVVLGNGGDLRTGLALQSVHSPNGHWFHEPLRLQVIVEAEPDRIEAVLDACPNVKALVENGWVRLRSLSPTGTESFTWVPGEGWNSDRFENGF